LNIEIFRIWRFIPPKVGCKFGNISGNIEAFLNFHIPEFSN